MNDINEIVVVGAGTDISKTAGIKSPYIASYTSTLHLQVKNSYPTTSTALNPKVEKLFDESHILSFYKAESKDLQTELSHSIYLDQYYNPKTEKIFGRRTRVQSVKSFNNDFITYQYEREKLNTSVTIFKDSISANKKTFALSKESNIPTDLLIKEDSIIYISGIANGFQYRDGHQYLSPAAQGYILKLDEALVEKSSYVSSSKQHSFINDLCDFDMSLLATGTNQMESTGMDVQVQCYNKDLVEQWTYTHRQSNAQKGIKSIYRDGQIYTLGETINVKNKKTNAFLLFLNQEGKFVKDIEIEREESYHPRDFIITKDFIYLVANKQALRTSNMQSVILQLDKDGNFVHEIIIE